MKMEKFNELYARICRKLGQDVAFEPSIKNQYTGMSVKLILEDINKTARLITEQADEDNDSVLKSLAMKIKDGAAAAISRSIDSFASFVKGILMNRIVRKVFSKKDVSLVQISIEKYCKKLDFDGDPAKEYAGLSERAKGFILLCDIDAIADECRRGIKGEPIKPITESVFSSVLKGAWFLLKLAVASILVIVGTAAWILNAIVKYVPTALTWIQGVSIISAAMMLGFGKEYISYLAKSAAADKTPLQESVDVGIDLYTSTPDDISIRLKTGGTYKTYVFKADEESDAKKQIADALLAMVSALFEIDSNREE